MASPSVYFTLKEAQLGADPLQIGPGANATIEVIFTPRHLGATESTTFLTCRGTGRRFRYQVFGEGIESPFGIRPLLGAAIPLNASYSSLLRLHNPETRPMRIVELYTSSSKLHFEPFSRDADHFFVYPFEEKVLGRVTFMGVESGKQEIFARVKFRFEGDSDEELHSLVIPIEVDVRNTPGIYASEPVLDFGIVSPLNTKQTLSLSVLNAKSDKAREIELDWIRTVPKRESVVKISFKPMALKPSQHYTTVANVTFTFDPAQVAAHAMKSFSGSILVHAKNQLETNKYDDLAIPWRARMLDGHLAIEESDRRFICSEIRDSSGTVKTVQVRNTLAMPIILYQIKLIDNDGDFFTVDEFDEPVVIAPLSKSSIFKLKFNGCATNEIDGLIEFKCPDDMNTNARMVMHTNASDFTFNIAYHSGRLKYQTLSQDSRQLDFGLMGLDENKCTQLMVQNFNPLDISVKKSSTLDGLAVYPMSTVKIDATSSMRESYRFHHTRIDDRATAFPVKLERNTTMFFECCISGTELGEFASVLNFVTDHQILRIPVKGQFGRGSMTVKNSPITLAETSAKDKSQIGAEIHVRSSFMSIFNVSTILSESPADIVFRPVQPRVPIRPNVDTMVGSVYYNISAQCPRTQFGCRGSLAMDYTKEGAEWQQVDHPANMARLDAEYYRRFRQRYEASIKRSLLLITDVGSTVEFEVSGRLKWPRLFQTDRNEIRFPDTVVITNTLNRQPNTSQKQVVIINPTNDWLQIQPLLMHDYRTPRDQLEIINKLKDDYPWLNSYAGTQRPKYSHQFGVGTPAVHTTGPQPWYIEPGEEKKLYLGFFPKDVREHETILILRNNLTVLEPLRLVGRGIEEKLRLANDSDQVEITILEEHLQDCKGDDMKASKGSINQIRIENHASIAAEIVNITINGHPCRGGGWEVMDCGGSSRLRNQGIVIKASTRSNPVTQRGVNREGSELFPLRYRPDFSMTQTESVLEVTTKMGNRFQFTLVAVLPPDYVAVCRQAIPRPNWEAPCRRVILIMMIVLIFGFTFMGYIESNYLVEQWMATEHHQHNHNSLQLVLPRLKSRLKEFEYVLLGKMYAEYFKFADQRELLRKANSTKQHNKTSSGDKKEEKKKNGLRERKGSNASSIKSTATTSSSTHGVKTAKTTAESILALKRM